MPQPILGIKGTAEYVEASGNGTVESPYIPTVSLASELGYLMFRNTGLATSPQAIKTTPGFVMGWNFINVNTVPVYVKFYNSTVANTTVGTSTPSIPLLTLFVPPGTTGVPGVFFQEAGLIPQEIFSTAITIACVTGLADNSSTAPATAIHVSVRYK